MSTNPIKGRKINSKTTFKKKKPISRGAKSIIGRGPKGKVKRVETDSSQFNLRSYLCPEGRGTPLGVAAVKDARELSF